MADFKNQEIFYVPDDYNCVKMDLAIYILGVSTNLFEEKKWKT